MARLRHMYRIHTLMVNLEAPGFSLFSSRTLQAITRIRSSGGLQYCIIFFVFIPRIPEGDPFSNIYAGDSVHLRTPVLSFPDQSIRDPVGRCLGGDY